MPVVLRYPVKAQVAMVRASAGGPDLSYAASWREWEDAKETCGGHSLCCACWSPTYRHCVSESDASATL